MNKLIQKINHLIFRIKLAIPIVKLFPSYLKDSFRHQMVRLNKTDKNILFRLDDEFLFRDDGGFGREAFYLLNIFSDGGYNVFFYRPNDFRSYWRLGFLGRLIYRIKHLKFVNKIPDNIENFIYAFDTIHPDLLKLPWKRMVYINIKRATTCHVGNSIPMQFYMMPFIYAYGLDQKLEIFRNLTRKYRIFFGGSLSTVYYDSPVFKKKYPHLMTRLEGVRSVKDANLDVWIIKDSNDLRKFLNNRDYLNRLVIVDTKGVFPIKPEIWIRIVGQSDFFMCFSGTDYPMCHNAIEAMAVGSIPILAYADWFFPKLEHGKNAIIYSDKEDMINKIKLAMHMPAQEIRDLRKGVLEYFDNYLDRGYMARQYENQARSISTLMLFPKIVSDPKEEMEAQDFIQEFQKLNTQEEVLK